MSLQWKTYYTRPFWIGDYEIGSTGIIIPLSKGLVNEILGVPREGKTEMVFHPSEFDTYTKHLAQEFINPNFSLEEHLKRFLHAQIQLEYAVNSIQQKASNAAQPELLLLYTHLCEGFMEFGPFIWYPWGITSFLESWLTERLQQHFSEWESIIDTIGHSPKRIQMDQMIDHVCAWHIKQGAQEELQHITTKFGHLGGYSSAHSPWTSDEIVKRSQPLEQCKQRLHEYPLREQRVKKEYSRVRRNIAAINEQLAVVSDVIHEYVWLRTERIDVFKWAVMNMAPLYRRIERNMHWPFGWATHLTKQEVLEILHGTSFVSNTEMKQRAEGSYVAHMTISGTHIYSKPHERDKFLYTQFGAPQLQQRSVQGQIACKGNVQGKVRVLLHTEQVYDFQKGEILVSNMTHPDYMPAIQKAAGIITDEGGIVCHASVISRELGIPCIIGTGDATKIFKTGDMVRLDTTNGIATKLPNQ